MSIVWNKRSRLRAFDRIREEIGVEQDHRPELTGVVMVVTGVGSEERHAFFLKLIRVFQLALVLALGVVLILLPADRRSVGMSLLFAVVGIGLLALSLSRSNHVLFANEQGLTIVRVSKFRYRLKGVDVQDIPPRGIIELSPLGRIGGPHFVGRYRRIEGDVVFVIGSRPSRESQEWLTTRFGRFHLPAPPMPAPSKTSPSGSPWVLIAIAAAVVVVGFLLPKGPDSHRFVGEGISVVLPRGWEAYPDIDSDFPAGDAEDVREVLDEDRQGILRLAGLDVPRRVLISAYPTSPLDDALSIADEMAEGLEDDGLPILSRGRMSVDGNVAGTFVLDSTDEGWRSFVVTWIEGYQWWSAIWEAPTADFSDALPEFRAAMKTVKTESGIPGT